MRAWSAVSTLVLLVLAAGGCTLPSDTSHYCRSCTANSDCGGSDNFCVGTGTSGFCGTDCSLGQTCPASSHCVTVTAKGLAEGENCVPVEGAVCATGSGGGGGGTGGGGGGGGSVGPLNCSGPFITHITNPAATDLHVIIDGSGFGSTKGQVTFGSTPAVSITSWSDTQIRAWIYGIALTLPVTVTVTVTTANGTSCGYQGVQVETGSCVSAGTRVSLVGGKDKPIEEVIAGDRILAIDPKTKRVREAAVNQLITHQGKGFALSTLHLSRGQRLEVTANHPVLTSSSTWVAVEDLRPGDVVYTLDPVEKRAVKSTIVSIVRDESRADVVYNLSTTAHNYFANDLLIHNKCLAQGSLIDTPSGRVPIDALKVGQLVYGEERGLRVPTPVTHVFAKSTVLSTLPGKRLTPGVAATINHRVRVGSSFVAAGATPRPDEEIPGTVYDLETATGNYFADGWLMKAGD
ncbi:MAG: hypothetical protein ACYC8T_05675 [Myxococcaceae bacterium]